MSELFGLDRECVKAIAEITDEELSLLENVDTATAVVLGRVFQRLWHERRVEFYGASMAVHAWFQDDKKDLAAKTIATSEILRSEFLQDMEETEVKEIVWLIFTWLSQSISAGVLKLISYPLPYPTENYQRVADAMQQCVAEIWKGCPWQQREMVRGYLKAWNRVIVPVDSHAVTSDVPV